MTEGGGAADAAVEGGHDRADARPRLDVYVASDCASCTAAEAVAERARTEFPSVDVRVVNLDVSSIRPPSGVVAVPTFMLNGRVISLGTPSWEQIDARLRAAIAEDQWL